VLDLRVRQLHGLLREVRLRGLHVPDLQPRDLPVRRVLGRVQQLHLCGLLLPDLPARRLIFSELARRGRFTRE
jgi:hypothetical protein